MYSQNLNIQIAISYFLYNFSAGYCAQAQYNDQIIDYLVYFSKQFLFEIQNLTVFLNSIQTIQMSILLLKNDNQQKIIIEKIIELFR